MDHVHLEPNELSQECSGGFRTSIFPAKLDQNIAIFDPAEFAQPAEKRSGKVRPAAGAEKADGQQLSWLLRARRQWPHGCGAAEPCNEFAPSDHQQIPTAFIGESPHACQGYHNFSAQRDVAHTSLQLRRRYQRADSAPAGEMSLCGPWQNPRRAESGSAY